MVLDRLKMRGSSGTEGGSGRQKTKGGQLVEQSGAGGRLVGSHLTKLQKQFLEISKNFDRMRDSLETERGANLKTIQFKTRSKRTRSKPG